MAGSTSNWLLSTYRDICVERQLTKLIVSVACTMATDNDYIYQHLSLLPRLWRCMSGLCGDSVLHCGLVGVLPVLRDVILLARPTSLNSWSHSSR